MDQQNQDRDGARLQGPPCRALNPFMRDFNEAFNLLVFPQLSFFLIAQCVPFVKMGRRASRVKGTRDNATPPPPENAIDKKGTPRV
jgi:hypothetical protein